MSICESSSGFLANPLLIARCYCGRNSYAQKGVRENIGNWALAGVSLRLSRPPEAQILTIDRDFLITHCPSSYGW